MKVSDIFNRPFAFVLRTVKPQTHPFSGPGSTSFWFFSSQQALNWELKTKPKKKNKNRVLNVNAIAESINKKNLKIKRNDGVICCKKLQYTKKKKEKKSRLSSSAYLSGPDGSFQIFSSVHLCLSLDHASTHPLFSLYL